MKNKKDILVLIIIMLLLVLILIFLPLNKDYIKSDIYISEVMANNYSTILDNRLEYSDYIEIHNVSNKSINLEGYHISDDEFNIKKYTFPNIIIKPDEYLLIYASGLNKYEENTIHLPFKLSSKGETLILTDEAGNVESKIIYPELDKDVSYGYNGNKYIMFEIPTPGTKNNNQELVIRKKKYNLVINEYMLHNKKTIYDEYGNYYDWVEIYNASDTNEVLDNIYITDNKDNLKKYKLPKTEIKKNGYLLLYFSKEKVNYNTNIYIPFSISDKDEYIIISDGKKVIDKVNIVELYDDISYGKVDDTYKYFTSATPGSINDTKFFDKIGDIYGSN